MELPEEVGGEEVSVDAAKTFLFEHGREVKVHVSIPKDFARPGEHLPVHVEIRNETRRHLRGFLITLFRKEFIRYSSTLVMTMVHTVRVSVGPCVRLSVATGAQ